MVELARLSKGNIRISMYQDINAARNICARAGWSRGRAGISPSAARNTNNHRQTEPASAATQVGAAEQYANAPGHCAGTPQAFPARRRFAP